MGRLLLAAALCCMPVLSSSASVFYDNVPPGSQCRAGDMDQCCRLVKARVLGGDRRLWECPSADYLPKGMLEQRYVPVVRQEAPPLHLRYLVPLPPRKPSQ